MYKITHKTTGQQNWEFRERVGLKMTLLAIAGLGLAAVAFSLGLFGPTAKQEPTFAEAAAAAQAKADARNAQAEAARQDGTR